MIVAQLEITIQQETIAGWPVVIDARFPDLLQRRSQGFLHLPEAEDQLKAWQTALLSVDGSTKQNGEMLSRAIFRDQRRDLYLQAVNDAGDDPLPVLIVVEVPKLQTLFWERLAAPSPNGSWQLLALSQEKPLTRYLPTLPTQPFAPFGKQDLCALILLANLPETAGDTVAHFDEAATLTGLQRALGSIPHDAPGSVPGSDGPPTLDKLSGRLTEKRYTLLHIVAHGRLSKRDGAAALLLLDEQSVLSPERAERLVERLRYVRNLPHHIYLNTCDSTAFHRHRRKCTNRAE
jgi:hypothetical protein